MKERNYNVSSILYILCSLCWAFCAVVSFMNGEHLAGGIQIALTCFFFGLAIVHFKRAKEQEKRK